MSVRRSDPALRLVGNVAINPGTACWEWQRSLNSSGYGRISAYGHDVYTHRLAYEISFGKIPPSLEIDHLCRNRACCNPEHLEAVTGAENTRRGAAVKTHCPAGHEYAGANVYVAPRGDRQCRICRKEKKAAFDARRRQG